MRVLFLTPYLPYPPNKGTALRNLHLLRGAARSHLVHLLTFGRESDNEAIQVLRKEVAGVEAVPPPQRSSLRRLAGVPSLQPDLASRLHSSAFRAALGRALESMDPDLVQVEGLEMAPYGLEICRRRGASRRPLVLFDAHNAEYALQRSAFQSDLTAPGRWPGAAYSFIQWRKLIRYEQEVCRQADGVLAVSQADAEGLQSLDPNLRPVVLPNGVDTSFFTYRSRPATDTATSPNLVFTGTLDYRPNVDAAVWFCQHILPAVQRQCPAVKVSLVGRDPNRVVKGLVSPNITVTGAVDDVRPYLYQSHVFVAPLRMGSGTRFKLLEAMACGLPVVSTTIGIQGIAATPGQEALVADSPADFAARVLELLESPSRAQGLATRARLLVEHQYDWKVVLPRLEEVYRGLARAVPKGAGRVII